MRKIFIIIICWVLSGVSVFAQMDVPANLQVALFYKIFDFDRSLAETPGEQIVIAIFYNPQNSQSIQSKDEIKENFDQLTDMKIGGKSVIIKEITSVEDLHDTNIVYVTPGSDSSISAIVDKCHQFKILSISGVEQYAQQGLVIAIKLENQKPRIVINNASLQSSGVNLSSQLLALAQIV